jgi:hypothetical protein
VVQEVGLRFDDGISTVLHDPLMSAISMANYVASRLIADPMGNYPGTRQWLDRLGMPPWRRIDPMRVSGQWRLPRFPYDHRWLETRWNILSGPRINHSFPILTYDDVNSSLSDRLQYLCSEDMKGLRCC